MMSVRTIWRGLMVMALSVALLVTMSGCGATVAERQANAERTLQGVAITVKDLVETDVIRDRQVLLALRGGLLEANAALQASYERVAAGQDVDAAYWVDRSLSAVNRVMEYVVRVKRKK